MALVRHPYQQPLDAQWQFAEVATNELPAIEFASQIADLRWQTAQVPGTVASSLHALERFTYGAQQFDDADYWFRCHCDLPQAAVLCFDGLASLSEVFWNDILLFSSENMFVQHRIDLSAHLASTDSMIHSGILSLRFRSLNTALKIRRPRGRWRTRLVEQQQLRWIRTSLLGRMPGWSPPVAAVGPYRAIRIEIANDIRIVDADVRPRLDVSGAPQTSNTTEQSTGTVSAKIRIAATTPIDQVILHVGDTQCQLDIADQTSGDSPAFMASGELRLTNPSLWWPHTHGQPALYPAQIEIISAGQRHLLDLGKLGFRSIQVRQEQDDFHLHVNGVPVFCRGACWMPPDILSLAGDETSLRPSLLLARDAGMNMIRVVGTMQYESDTFYRLCDELGILVWQDFMFANMDYPVDDPVFSASILHEASQFLNRIQLSPCVAVLCGSSEIEQQAAMLGVSRDMWRNRFFADSLPQLCAGFLPETSYVPSSPCGGVMPFQLDAGVSHYFGVGAYLRPLDDARRAGLRFTSECLGFSNMPDDSTIEQFLQNGEAPGPHPSWKQRIPRDNGTSWDFEDVRDHYMAQLYQVDPASLRYADMPRYLALSRVSTGEVMAQTLAEWRRAGSTCHGALIWFLRDLWPGAGWGLIDAFGKPKAAYYYVRRAMAALTVLITDEGLNGLAIHIVNDSPAPVQAELQLDLYRHGETPIAHGVQAVTINAHSTIQIRADSLLEHFFDTAYAYRFGPPGHDVAIARLRSANADADAGGNGIPYCAAFYFPTGIKHHGERDLGLQAQFEPAEPTSITDDFVVYLTTRKLALSVFIDVPGYLPDDNYFHLAPGAIREIRLTSSAASPSGKKSVQGSVFALNAISPVKISKPASPSE
ncbi:glycosyl hydrolase 2 galactose-binding domain-containing protein [Undibacterium sp. RuTC16W]|uniref:glycoside hydrolase family 2 protein n=1 Tax=Undibacterium sp. RuTC16W TaxID=3413048 RepID=UPI003BF36CBA